MNTSDLKVAIIGSGLIGRSWSMIFASAGYKVSLYDIVASQVEDALAEILVQLQNLKQTGLLRGVLSPEEQHANISGHTELQQAVDGAFFVQECVPENQEIKTKVLLELDAFIGSETIVSSSVSYMPASLFSADMRHRHNVIVSHPVNPPYYVPLVELVPAPWTKPEVVTKTKEIMTQVGQQPVVLRRELDGFALNRIQVAILTECYRLYEGDVMSVEDIDKVMTYGLGPRYVFNGPLMTTHLNASGGLADYAEKYGTSVNRIADSFGPAPQLKGDLGQRLHDECAKLVPVDKLRERHQARDARLAALAKLRQDMDQQHPQ